MADSYVAWTATIKSLAPNTGRMSVLYETADSDASRPGIYQSIILGPTEWNDSDIRAKIKSQELSVVRRWNTIITANQAADSDAFNDSDFLGLTINDAYKPTTTIGVSDYNPLRYKVVDSTVEGAESITVTRNLVLMDSAEKQEYYNLYSSAASSAVYKQLVIGGVYDNLETSLRAGEPISASWDASSGAAFNWSNDKIASRGVDSVSRIEEGVYRVYFSTAMPDSNWTAVTAVGADDYSGAGASPRQLAVLRDSNHVSPNYATVVCERADDGVNEDNAYMSIVVTYPTASSKLEILFETATSIRHGDSLGTEIQSALGLNDSDWANYLYLASEAPQTS